jgi:hypothetical protein
MVIPRVTASGPVRVRMFKSLPVAAAAAIACGYMLSLGPSLGRRLSGSTSPALGAAAVTAFMLAGGMMQRFSGECLLGLR